MKHLKTFENNNLLSPTPGDYVLCTTRTPKMKTELGEFLKHNIGKVVDWFDYDHHHTHDGNIEVYRRFVVEFENLPEEFRHSNPKILSNLPNKNCMIFPLKTIVELSPNKEELEVSMQTKKYNI